MDEYDRNPPTGDRPDFMAWIRQSSVKGEPMSDADLVNHLSNNLVRLPRFGSIGMIQLIHHSWLGVTPRLSHFELFSTI